MLLVGNSEAGGIQITHSLTPHQLSEKNNPRTSDNVFLHLFPVIPEAVFLPDVLLPNSFNQPLPNTIALPSIGFGPIHVPPCAERWQRDSHIR